jgi:hypothetical protein
VLHRLDRPWAWRGYEASQLWPGQGRARRWRLQAAHVVAAAVEVAVDVAIGLDWSLLVEWRGVQLATADRAEERTVLAPTGGNAALEVRPGRPHLLGGQVGALVQRISDHGVGSAQLGQHGGRW